jgi:hypothetical protein
MHKFPFKSTNHDFSIPFHVRDADVYSLVANPLTSFTTLSYHHAMTAYRHKKGWAARMMGFATAGLYLIALGANHE